MYCKEHLTSTYLCGCDCDCAFIYSTSLRAKSSTPRREPPHKPSCCCKYDPFTEEAKDTEIHDLEFTLRKLAVMKCQMKKWRIEKLQLESENRSLKNKLQSLGINVRNPVAEDPLLNHYRDENNRLERMKEQLEERIKDMEAIINEQELYKNPCHGIKIIRGKMRILREHSNRDIQKLEETKKGLLIKLVDSGGESSCAGVNRLRARLRELIDQLDVKKIDESTQQFDIIDERSIETFTALSKSCDDLRIENKRLRVENQNLRRALRPAGDDVDIDSGGIGKPSAISDKLEDGRINVVGISKQGEIQDPSISQQKDDNKAMKMKLLESNNLIEDLRRRISEKDDVIQSFQKKMRHEMEKMQINHDTLMKQISNDKEQLKKYDEKVGKLLNQLGQNPSTVLESDHIESQFNMVQQRFNELETERNKLLDDVTKFHCILSDKDEEISKLLSEKDNILRDSVAKSTELQARINDLVHQEISQGEIDELQKETKVILSLRRRNDEIENKSEDNAQLELTTLKKELAQLIVRLGETQRKNDNLQKERDTLKQQIAGKEELSNKIADNIDLTTSVNKLTSELTEIRLENESLKKQIDGMMRDIDDQKNKLSFSELENDESDVLEEVLGEEKVVKNIALNKINNFNDEFRALRNELKNYHDENEKLASESETLRLEKEKMLMTLSNMREKMGELRKFREDLERCKRDLNSPKDSEKESNIVADNSVLDEIEALKNTLEKMTKDLEKSDMENGRLHSELEKCNDDAEILKTELKSVRDENMKTTGEFKAVKNKLGHLNREMDEMNLQNSRLEGDLMRMRQVMESMTTDRNKLEMENAAMKKNIDELSHEPRNYVGDVAELKGEIVHSKMENKELKTQLEIVRTSGDFGNRILEKNEDIQSQKPSKISEEHLSLQIHSDTPDILNELIKVLNVIYGEMKKQKKGVIRIRENIENIEKQIWPDSSKYTNLDDSIVLNTTNPAIAKVFQLLGSLSTEISCAEKELINFGEASKACLEKKSDENLENVGTFVTPGLLNGRTAKDGGSFDPETWLATLTLTQLAELHDKICFLTSNLVIQDISLEQPGNPDAAISPPHNQNSLQQNYNVLSNRIAALQCEIQEKQKEARKRVFEMRQILRQEQEELLRISEAMGREKKRNFILQFAINEPPCWVYNCTANCAKSVKFIENIARGK